MAELRHQMPTIPNYYFFSLPPYVAAQALSLGELVVLLVPTMTLSLTLSVDFRSHIIPLSCCYLVCVVAQGWQDFLPLVGTIRNYLSLGAHLPFSTFLCDFPLGPAHLIQLLKV